MMLVRVGLRSALVARPSSPRMAIKMIFGNGTAYPVATPKMISLAC